MNILKKKNTELYALNGKFYVMWLGLNFLKVPDENPVLEQESMSETQLEVKKQRPSKERRLSCKYNNYR